LKAWRENVAFDDASALAALCARTDIRYECDAAGARVFLDGVDVTEELAGPDAAAAASAVSAQAGVRAALLTLQRRLARPPGVVIEGRDIGTVVFPAARYKFYLDASLAERARRRRRDLEALGIARAAGDVAVDLETRDGRDTARATAPLRRAPDAIYVDTTDLALDEVVSFIVGVVRRGERAP
jgi:cytidylate kinase